MDSDPRGRGPELMRAGVRDRVARLAGTAGGRVRGWSPPVLVGVLCGGAFAPLVTTGVGGTALLAAATGAITSVGGNVLSDVVTSRVGRLGEHAGGEDGGGARLEEVEAALASEIQRLLEAGGRRAEELRTEIAEVLEKVGLVGVALEEAARFGDGELLEALTVGLAEVGREFGEFGFVLADVRSQLRLLRDGVDEQGGQMRVAVGLLQRQATLTRILLEQVDTIEERTRSGRAQAARGEGPVPRWEGCPYRGLAPFGEADREVFYGRERVTAQLVSVVSQRLAAPGLVVVTGASGAGKSSLLRAGLLPAIGRGELHEPAREWPRHVIEAPSGRPLERLASVLAPMAGLDAATVHASLADAPERAHLLVRQAVEGDARRRGLPAEVAKACRLVLVVDQFEELFTVGTAGEGDGESADGGADAEEVAAFVAALDAVATRPCGAADAPAALVVIAVRGDFVDRCAAHPVLADALQNGQFVLGPMREQDLRLTIAGPAAAAGLELEAGLTDTIVAGLGSPAGGLGPGALPLVSQTMLTVWEHREGDRLTLRGYARTGDVTHAVATSAEDAYAGLGDPARQTARRVFVHLAVVSPPGRLTRRAVTRAELHRAIAPDTSVRLDQVLGAFAARRLVTVDTGTVQISHDVLLEAWPRLRDWLRGDLAGHALQAQLVQDTDEWDRNGRAPAYLYRGQRLAEVQHVRARWNTDPGRYPALPSAAAEFLAAGAAAETRRTRHRRIILATVAGLLAVALVAASIAFRAQNNADHQRDMAVSRQLAAQSELFPGDSTLSALLAAAAWRIQHTPESRARLIDILSRPDRAVLTSQPRRALSVAFGPDGRVLATGDEDGALRLWDMDTQGQIGTLTGRTEGVYSVAFSPDGRVLATGDEDGTVRLWDVAARHQIGKPLIGHTREVNSVVFSLNGKALATGSDDGTVRIWDVGTHRQSGALTGNTGPVRSVAFSPDGRLLATGGEDDNTVRLWDVRTHRQTGALTGNTGPVRSVAFSPDGRLLATGGENDNTVRLWDVNTHRQSGALTGLTSSVRSTAFSPDGRLLATGSHDGTVRVWDVRSHRQTGALTGHTGPVRSMTFSPDGKALATGSDDSTVRLWDVATHHQLGALTSYTRDVNSVVFSPDGRALATGDDDNMVRLWDMGTHSQVGALTGHTSPVRSVVFSPDGKALATGSQDDGTVRLWDVGTHRQTGALTGHAGPVRSVAFSPDGKALASGGHDGTVRLWDVATHHRTGALTGHTEGVYSVVFSPDGRVLATGGHDGKIRLWDVSTHRQVGALTGQTGPVRSVAFSPDGKALASGGDDNTVRLWDVATRNQTGAPLLGHTREVNSVAFSPDGKALASGSDDGTVRLWDVATHLRTGAPLSGHIRDVTSVVFSPDGKALATGSDDGTVRLWNVAMPDDLIGAVCAAAGRTMTRAEWARYVPPGPKFRRICS
ncbi:AAA family ATPase [Actinomadura syzygii]|uniref:DNA-binding protein n=1 Tax=Actinomadura syzygii TaxID=1427538 RepID=A0A5D0TTS2_9ACTN|nr:AAA family ATPase [Actinomadura syzygii]TYC08239.1 DNA-binding protein [Actinomadura syzygii]